MRASKINLLKFVDHWVGCPVCVVLAVFNRLLHPFWKVHFTIPARYLPPRNILIIKFFGLGSMALSSAMVSKIRSTYKTSRIIFLTFKENLEILGLLSLADEVLVIETRNPFVLIASIWRFVLYCHRQKIDIAMDIEFYSKFSTIMTFLSGAPMRMGFHLSRFWRDSLVNVPIPFNYSRHLVEIYGMFTAAMLIKDPDGDIARIEVSAESRAETARILKAHNVRDLGRTIAMNIHASELALFRRWPLPKFAQLTALFLERYSGWTIVLTGVKNEQAYSRELLALLPAQFQRKVIDLTGELTLTQTLALLSQLPLFITNDTGPYHLAKAVGTPTISLWGPSSVELYGPYQGEKDLHEVISKRFQCSPCMYTYRTQPGFLCGQKAPCMQAIDAFEVMAAVNRRLKNTE